MRLTVRITPRASKNAVLGWAEDADGGKYLKVSVTAVPEKGKANRAVIEILSQAFKLPKSAFTIVRGETDRIKLIDIEGLSCNDLPDLR